MNRTSNGWLPSLVLLSAGLALPVRGHADEPKRAERPSEQSATAAPADSVPYAVAHAELVQAAETRIRRAMQTRVTLAFRDKPLDEVLKALAERGKLPLWIGRKTLKDAGIVVSTPLVTVELNDVTIAQSRDRILKPLDLAWLIEDEVLKVTTDEATREIMFTRVYNVAEFLRAARQVETTAEATGLAAQSFPGMLSDGLAPGSQLIEAIQNQTSGPWFDLAGEGGTTNLVNDLLIVRQTWTNHEQIAGLLNVFSTFISGRLNDGAMPIRRRNYPHAADAAIHEALNRRIAVKYHEVSLQSVLDDLASRTGMTIVADQRMLELAGILLSELRTSLEHEGITVRSAVKLTLDPEGLTFLVDEGVLTITSTTGAGERLFAVAYDVRDLTDAGFNSPEQIDVLQRETSGPWLNQQGEGGKISAPLPGMLVVSQTHRVHDEITVLLAAMRKRIAESPPSRPTPAKPGPDEVVVRFYPIIDKDTASDLQKAIPSFVAPETWEGNGGQGTIQLVGETLAVRQSVKVHGEIRKFLSDLSRAEESGLFIPNQGNSGFFDVKP